MRPSAGGLSPRPSVHTRGDSARGDAGSNGSGRRDAGNGGIAPRPLVFLHGVGLGLVRQLSSLQTPQKVPHCSCVMCAPSSIGSSNANQQAPPGPIWRRPLTCAGIPLWLCGPAQWPCQACRRDSDAATQSDTLRLKPAPVNASRPALEHMRLHQQTISCAARRPSARFCIVTAEQAENHALQEAHALCHEWFCARAESIPHPKEMHMPQRLTPTVFDPQKDIHLSSGLVANTYIFQYAGAIPALCAHAGGRCAASPGHPGGGS